MDDTVSALSDHTQLMCLSDTHHDHTTTQSSIYILPNEYTLYVDNQPITIQVDKEYKLYSRVYSGGYQHKIKKTIHFNAATQTIRFSKQHTKQSNTSKTGVYKIIFYNAALHIYLFHVCFNCCILLLFV